MSRAILLIAAGVLFVSAAPAQEDASRIVETFARDAQRAEARKQEAARKAAEAKREKQQSELRKRAEAQHAEAVARRKAAELRAAEEAEMLERARQEAEELKATADIRRLIEEAEAARRRAENLLPANSSTLVEAPAHAWKSDGVREDVSPAYAGERDGVTPAVRTAAQEKVAGISIREHRTRVTSLRGVARVRDRRIAARAQAEALQFAQARKARSSLLRTAKLRQVRAEALAQAAARAAENRGVAMAQAPAPQEQTHGLPAGNNAVQSRDEVVEARPFEPAKETPAATGVGSKALSPGTPEMAPARAPSRLPEHPRLAAGGEPFERVVEPGSEWTGQVTVLVVMAPGTYGIRRGSRTADPVLCSADGCYISSGPDRPASFLPRRKALGFGNTFGRRAGACRQRLGCVFRAVAFDYPGMLQPVDLHILKHDRRRPQAVVADSHCRIAGGHLACQRPIHGDDYIMWVIPERLADRAGPEVLERALRSGLSPLRSAETFGAR